MDTLNALLGTTPAIFLGLTVVLVGGAAILTGRAVAGNWKPAWHVVLACFGLALGDRFLIFALFQGELVELWGILIHFLVLAAMGLIAWQTARVSKLVGQYPWRYRRTSPFGYAVMNDG